jgi:putative PIN family toxin of toxin-antitoxin system
VRVFFDTNVIVAAFAARGLCADLMRVVLAEHQLMTGEVNLAELRPILRKKLKASVAQADAVEAILREQVVVPRPEVLLPIPIRDEDDAWVLASAVAGEAELLVTGDKDLLVVAEESPVPVVTPRAAWERLRGPGAA